MPFTPEVLDQIYSEAGPNGELVAPISQGAGGDLRSMRPGLGQTGSVLSGVCRAMTYMWAKERIKNLPAFGINPDAPRIGAIPSNTPIARSFPGINSRVLVTPETRRLQVAGVESDLEYLSLKQTVVGTGDVLPGSTNIFEFTTLILGGYAVAVAMLGLTGTPGGHALGLRVKAPAFEFFDANSGWYQFASVERMQNFFVRYILNVGYRSEFGGRWAVYILERT